jgi:GDP-fucose transporter C1
MFPCMFLLIQVVIAAMLLHVTAFFSRRVELPMVDKDTAKKLIPVIFVNAIGLISNTLCLREVEATFYQVWFD